MLRTQPDVSVFSCEQMQCMLIRILFTWAVRHPASAYVQGINDLCAPLLLVFLSEYVIKADMADEELFKSTKHIREVNRMIKTSFHNLSPNPKQPPEQTQDKTEMFNATQTEKILVTKQR